MRERVCQFGAQKTLTGIVTIAGAPSEERPAVLFLNAGTLHRVGPCRLHVRLARVLADLGFTSLRFDFSGVGDSLPRGDNLPFERSSVIETGEAMDCLEQRYGCRSFILFGLCSGADAALFSAIADSRAVGIIQLDGFVYRTLGFYWKHYAPRLMQPAVWGRALRHPGAAARVMFGGSGGDAEAAGDSDAPLYTRAFPPRENVTELLSKLADRGVRFYSLYTDGMSETMNYRGQFEDCYREVDFHNRLTVDYCPEMDHLITGLEHQDLVVRRIATWLKKHWPGASVEVQTQQAPARLSS